MNVAGRNPTLPVDTTLLTIVALLVLATGIALARAHRRDRCLKGLQDFHVTLAEQDGDLTWGRADVYSTGVEIVYRRPVIASQGHLERSFIFYADQYDGMEALYRCPKGLSVEEQERRDALIDRTARPGVIRRAARAVRTWASMVRDALVQAVGMLLGLAKTKSPGSAVLSSQRSNVTALSSEIIGHVGNAYDPLLEEHLFTQVVVEVTSDAVTRSYCGWLKHYTADFLTVLDAYANARDVQTRPVRPVAPGSDAMQGLDVFIEADRLHVVNDGPSLLYVAHVDAGHAENDADASIRTDAVLPSGHTLDVQLPPGTDPDAVRVHAGTADRVDMVIPRRHALVRHAAGGSAEHYAQHRKRVKETEEGETPR